MRKKNLRFNFKYFCACGCLCVYMLICACVLLQYTASLIGSCLLAVVSQTLTPPPHLPDLYPVMIAAYCFAHFAVFLVYFHYLQLTS